MKFLDQAKIYVKAGNGGSGSSSFRREKFVEFGGPDGGDGGTGGSVIFESERNLNTLIDFRYKQHFNAEHGKSGSKKNKTGGGGKDLILQVPTGTQIFEEDVTALPVTMLQSVPMTVVQKKTLEKDGCNHVQVGFEEIPERKIKIVYCF